MGGVSIQEIRCNAKYLCEKPNGIEFCHIINSDYRACPEYREENIMLLNPEEIRCNEAYKCKYAGKRPEHCIIREGNAECGITINGKIPEGDIPEGLVQKVRRAIPACHNRP